VSESDRLPPGSATGDFDFFVIRRDRDLVHGIAQDVKKGVNKRLSEQLLASEEGRRLLDEMLVDRFTAKGPFGEAVRHHTAVAVELTQSWREQFPEMADRGQISSILKQVIANASSTDSNPVTGIHKEKARDFLLHLGFDPDEHPSLHEVAARLVVRSFVDGWAGSATQRASVASQHAMAADFKGQMDTKYLVTHTEAPDRKKDPWSSSMAKLLNDIEYRDTQAFLRERLGPDVTSIRLFRGVIGQVQGRGLGAEVAIDMNPLSSWSTDRQAARNFGHLVAMTVPIEMIQSTALTGRGCLREEEFILRGFPSVAEVTA